MSDYKDKVQGLPWRHSPWHVEEADDAVRDSDGHLVCAVANSAHAQLIAEAGTVLHETGLTPRELVEQRSRLLALMKRAPKATRDMYIGRDTVSWGKQAAALVAAFTPKAK